MLAVWAGAAILETSGGASGLRKRSFRVRRPRLGLEAPGASGGWGWPRTGAWGAQQPQMPRKSITLRFFIERLAVKRGTFTDCLRAGSVSAFRARAELAQVPFRARRPRSNENFERASSSHNSPRKALASSAGVNDANSASTSRCNRCNSSSFPRNVIQPGDDGALLGVEGTGIGIASDLFPVDLRTAQLRPSPADRAR